MVPLLTRLLVAVGIGFLLLLLLLAPGDLHGGSGAAPTCARAAGLNHVAIVVQHQSGGSFARCAEFTSTDIGAEEALARAKIQYATSDAYGGPGYRALCQVDGEPATFPQACLNSDTYWSLWIRSGGSWAPAPVGISSIRLHDGDWFGVRFLQYHHESPPPPPGAVCAAIASPPPTALPLPSPQAVNPTDPAPHPQTPLPSEAPVATTEPTNQPSASPEVSPLPGTVAPGRQPAPPQRGGGKADLGLLAAAAGGGALVGLLVIQLIARRRR